MKKNIITLTNEMLSLISCINVREMDYELDDNGTTVIAGIENKSIYGGSDILEDISRAIGWYDKHIGGTEENPNGIQFDEDVENEMYDMHEYIIENIVYIENLLHYWSNKGGLTSGSYNVMTLQKID